MPRSGRLRSFIKEYKESPRFEKISFIPPFLILIVEFILIEHELTTENPDIMVIELTAILLIISIVEIVFVVQEMHQHYARSNFDRTITIRLDDFIRKNKKGNVQQLVADFTECNPEYYTHRNEIYHIACQIMQSHKDEEIEKNIDETLKSFLKKNKKKTVDDIIREYIKKYPKHKKYKIEIYEKICKYKKN